MLSIMFLITLIVAIIAIVADDYYWFQDYMVCLDNEYGRQDYGSIV